MNSLRARPPLEVADILRAHGEAYGACHPVSALQAAVMRRLVACRTAALGGHRDACGRCGYTRVSYNSCRDRHCPKCQGVKRAQWLETRLERLLPVEYFHVVFTVPAQLFRGKFLAGVKAAYQAGQLTLGGSVAALADPQLFRRWLDALYRQD